MQDFAIFSLKFGQPVDPKCSDPVDCGGGAAPAQGGGPQPDYDALAQWTIANIPAGGRQVLADRARQGAARTTDPAERDALLAFANAIEP